MAVTLGETLSQRESLGSANAPFGRWRPGAGDHAFGVRAILLVFFLLGCARGAASSGRATGTVTTSPRGQTLVAVFAHPDDETLVAPVLARYAREGVRVFLVVATDGRRGAAPWTGIPAGDSLAAVRAGEARCSARVLGLEPPILLGFPDAGLADFAAWPGQRLDTLAARIDSVLQVLQPDVVVTWGPDGGYGHADHRLTGQAVTQVFQSGDVGRRARLFYPGFDAERTVNAPRWYGQRLHAVRRDLLSATIAFSTDDRAAAFQSIACHWSQATSAQQERNRLALDHLWKGVVTFQQWGEGRRTSSLF